MSEGEFIASFASALGDVEGRDEIVADYRAHFEEGRQAGKSDAEIAAELGSPEDLAIEFLSEGIPGQGSGCREEHKKREPSAASGPLGLAVRIGAGLAAAAVGIGLVRGVRTIDVSASALESTAAVFAALGMASLVLVVVFLVLYLRGGPAGRPRK